MVEYDVLPDDFLLRFFPRNLSYSEESYLDNFSVCSTYIKPPKNNELRVKLVDVQKCLQTDNCVLCNADLDASDFDIGAIEKVKVTMEDEGTSVDMINRPDSPDELTDVGSEEGIFLNAMDDLEFVDPELRRDSDGSDPSYFSLDSVSSPDEGEFLKKTDVPEELSKSVTRELELQKSGLPQSLTENGVDTQETKGSKQPQNEEIDTKKSKHGFKDTIKVANLKIEMKGTPLQQDQASKYLIHVTESPVFEEPEFNFNRSELRKSSSLKSKKTPPGTPARKKMVRFADVMGLDLESIRHVLDTDNPPRIPASAIKDLKVGVEEERREIGSRYLDLCFPQPCALEGFMTKVLANKVSLENCVITDMSITGVVRVANVGYHKCVRVRYSVNNWVTFYDVMASYVQNSFDGVTDRFSFTIVSPTLGPGSKISFAVSYTVNDQVYWDNNGGKNYEILCYAKTTPTDLEASWLHFV